MMFPAIIKSLRKAKKLTQIQLAAAIGVSPGNVGDWETGKSLPSYTALIHLAKCLDVSADVLLGLEGQKHVKEELTDEENRLISQIRCLDPRDQKDIEDFVALKSQRAIDHK